MGALKIDPFEIGRVLRINQRFGSLLRTEREAAGYSPGKIARKFRLNRLDLQNWELGLSSPPAKVFYAIVEFYGRAALYRAAELDFEIQMEKYNLVTAFRKINSAPPKPSAIHDQLLAA